MLKLNERERQTEGEREEEGGGGGREGGGAGVGKEGKVRQRFGGTLAVFVTGISKKLRTTLLDHKILLSFQETPPFWKYTSSGSSPSAPPSCLHLSASRPFTNELGTAPLVLLSLPKTISLAM